MFRTERVLRAHEQQNNDVLHSRDNSTIAYTSSALGKRRPYQKHSRKNKIVVKEFVKNLLLFVTILPNLLLSYIPYSSKT
jgi:hypothetical protein